MLKLIAAAALAAVFTSASADVITSPEFTLRRSLDAIGTYDTEAECVEAARAINIVATYHCEPRLRVDVVPGTDHSGHGPAVDMALIPPSEDGFSTELITSTTELPTPQTSGAFRASCGYSHMNFDDAIVYPGQPGKAHLHTYFGNTGTQAFSTSESLLASGNSTCRGGTVNRTAYWVPSMIDTRAGKPVRPAAGGHGFYYKTGQISPSLVQPLPEGLMMIAGNAGNTSPTGGQGTYRWECPNSGLPVGQIIQDCPAGGVLKMSIYFPQCWDGVNLDSPDHKSHMAYPKSKACPPTHPVPIPAITFQIDYTVPLDAIPGTETGISKIWRLSSDKYDPSLPPGMSAHGDWFNGWEKSISGAWNTNCNQASKDCHSHLLGDGRKVNGSAP